MERRRARRHPDGVRAGDGAGQGRLEELDLFAVDEVTALEHSVEGGQQLVMKRTVDRGRVVERDAA